MAVRITPPFCCVIDVVTRTLPDFGGVRYPEIRKRLLQIMADDQSERRSEGFHSTDPTVIAQIREREQSRADEALHILQKIKTPSVRNIGLDGSRAIWLIALHNAGYRGIGRTLLTKMQRLYYKNAAHVFYPGIPYLQDMVMLEAKGFSHTAKQLYGTRHWYIKRSDGSVERGSFPIINPAELSKRRAKFGLPPALKKCKHYS